MIPARMGSERLPLKNLALLSGEPLVGYALRAAIGSESFDRVILNGDHDVFAPICARYGVEFYRRPRDLGSSETSSDLVVADFIKSFPEADVVTWVNPVCPLQSSSEIAATVKFFGEKNLDSLITVEERQVHAFFKGKAVNFEKNATFLRTQDIPSVELFAYSVMMWKADTFREAMRTRGYGMFCGDFGVYAVSRNAATMVKTFEDLRWIELLMGSQGNASHEPRYDPVALDFLGR